MLQPVFNFQGQGIREL